ncbi:MAG: hypothetical protein KF779_05250 [Hyphomonadaceae bacterium]|nr:hypothetical protein [Hyphomonadaceae bacterium]
MSEGEVVEQLVQFTNILLVGVSLIFSIVSAYVVALNYFIGTSNVAAKIGSFAFVSLVLGMLVVVMMGAQATQMGLIERLHELDGDGQLTAAGRAVLANAKPEWAGALTGHRYSIDDIVRLCTWAGLVFVYVALAYLTFLHRWTPDAIPVSIEERKR